MMEHSEYAAVGRLVHMCNENFEFISFSFPLIN